MPKRKQSTRSASKGRSKKMVTTGGDKDKSHPKSPQNRSGNEFFRATATADDATAPTDGVLLRQAHTKKDNNEKPLENVILPWVGSGTYKLGKDTTVQAVVDALECGYRCLDTAFIYGGETTEKHVGKAIQIALDKGILKSRQELFVTTKHWRKYHGYDETLECLNKSLKRLQLDYVDCYLIHWPGPAWNTMNRKNDMIAKYGPWHYAWDRFTPETMPDIRSETWRAMEDALKEGKVRSIGVSNFSVEHLKVLKQTATIWPPAVNQVELHPLFPQPELLKYCQQEGIVLQAYASLGGQDTGKKKWQELGLEGEIETETDSSQKMGKKKPKQKKLKDLVVSLVKCRPVVSLAQKLDVTPGQILLRWALSQNCAIIPKTGSKDRMRENLDALKFSLSQEDITRITADVQSAMAKAIVAEHAPKNEKEKEELLKQYGRLCWRKDPLRHGNFD